MKKTSVLLWVWSAIQLELDAVNGLEIAIIYITIKGDRIGHLQDKLLRD
ncbi:MULTISPECIES: hypothetical protein [unclassified Nostoc]|nr:MULTISPECIES: hypothetical protein [unclassified Nostoc]MDZ8125959.1 hypothetical protein [Nostoc sp. CmiVER01]MDZ8225825.1 hypothetical protein [Nostoc sp. ChiVER01]